MQAWNKIDNWPVDHQHCAKGDCKNPVEIVFTAVSHNGKRTAGPFSKFGTWDTDPKTKKTINLKLFPQYEFLNWIVRCLGCYEDELHATNRTVLQKVIERRDLKADEEYAKSAQQETQL